MIGYVVGTMRKSNKNKSKEKGYVSYFYYSVFVFVQKDGRLVMLREAGRVGCVRVRVPTKAS